MKQFHLLAAASTLAMFAASPAFAQAAAPQNPADAQQPAPQDDGAGFQDDIVVSATKTDKTLLDTPISVDVVTGAKIQQNQIRDLLDLQRVTPSLRVNQLQSSANTNFIIRGYGNGANNAGIEPSVGVFIDGVYRSRTAAQISDLPTPRLKRVEVLRGPQSTLFGKNASAGVISIVTAEPSFTTTGFTELTYGAFNEFIARADISGPISETVAYDIYSYYNRRDGYFEDRGSGVAENGRNRYGGRAQLLWQPNADVKFRLIGDYDKIDEVCCGVVNLVNGPTGAVVQALGGRLIPNQRFPDAAFYNFPSTNNVQNYGVSLQTDYTLDKFTLLTITSYRESLLRTQQDSDFTSADLIGSNRTNTDIKTFTNEFRIQSNFDGPFNFLLGNFYFNERIRVNDGLRFGRDFRNYANALAGGAIFPTVETGILGFPPGTFFQAGQGQFNDFRYKNSAYSFFGNFDLEVIRGVTATFGFNYTMDEKFVSSNSFTTDTFSTLDFVTIGNGVIRNQAIATGVGQALGLPTGRLATAQQIGQFAALQPAIFNQINAGATAFANANQNNPAVNPLLGLRPLQFLPASVNFPNAVEAGRTSDSNFSFTARLAWKINDEVSTYVTYAQGFKASSWNLSRDSRPLAANLPGLRAAGLLVPNLTTGTRFAGPELADNFEGGIKAKFRRVAFNLAAFYQILRGFQSNVFIGTGFALNNAGRQSTHGFEADVSWNPTRELTLNYAMTYLSPRYDRFPGAAGPNGTVVDLSGTRPSGIPDVTFTIGATFNKPLANGDRIILSSDFQYDAPTQDSDQIPGFLREFQNWNAAFSYRLKNNLELSVFGRNILDQRTITTIFPSVAQAGSVSGYANQPRTYGGTIRYTF
ncbi:MAG: TonB-dependent receptor [Sphingomonas sp.]|uniref:TonB-dependent receptor n=1 Tax=Sphingomonas sp. TaxID=28214 RepID=UPI002600F8FA|nr:TonB-dependent receptor [Sphingomonas sp.]MBX9881661.1 TonB-dependent receptor [Sphingomonas sp.]